MQRLSLALIVVLGSACGSTKPATTPPSDPVADVNMICAEAKIATSRDAFARSVEQKLTSQEGRNIFTGAGQGADDQKNALIKQGAHEVGVADWDCTAPLEKLYGPQKPMGAP